MDRQLFGRHLPPPGQRHLKELIEAGVRSSMLEDPAMRLAATTGRSAGTFAGGGLVVQRFLRPPTSPNDQAELLLAPMHMNMRRAMGRHRGTPGGTV